VFENVVTGKKKRKRKRKAKQQRHSAAHAAWRRKRYSHIDWGRGAKKNLREKEKENTLPFCVLEHPAFHF
jgi:hypothetical protein